jgi:hypothetical protein
VSDPDDFLHWVFVIGVAIVGLIVAGSLAFMCIDGVLESLAKRECARSGGKVERVSQWRADWYCNGGRAERAP